MDHRDLIESPSIERGKLIEKRMEMVSHLMHQMQKGENEEQYNNSNGFLKRIEKCSRLVRFANLFHRMFLE
ncbi:hypothetical protein [Paenibacillus sp. sgz302251]|uniref:hypothetical protein n=1 Tax=Paenibacillus sp. sgz302251 TaxID=3414493 RepID=UPI003C7B237E